MKKFENYPAWMIILADIVPLSIYIIGGYLTLQFNQSLFFLYLIYFAILELSFYPRACAYCYYYGKWCFCGKGKVAGLFFVKKDPKKFCRREAKFINLLPELLIVIIPIILGIYMVIRQFNIVILILVILDAILWSYGNALVRGKLACLHCKQGEICCPARDMFNKKNK